MSTVMTRRGILVGMAAMGAEVVQGQGVKVGAAGDFLGGSKVFTASEAAATKMPNGSKRMNVFDGTMATGEVMSMHQSWAPPGANAVTHVITHSEVIVVIAGTLGFTHDGKTETANAGDVIYVAYGTDHQVKNIGDGMATYVVLQVGGDTK